MHRPPSHDPWQGAGAPFLCALQPDLPCRRLVNQPSTGADQAPPLDLEARSDPKLPILRNAQHLITGQDDLERKGRKGR